MIKAMGLAYVVLAVSWLGAKLYISEVYPCPVGDAAAFDACMASQDRTMWIINGIWIALVVAIMAVAIRAARGKDKL
jgi:hypothetical protein